MDAHCSTRWGRPVAALRRLGLVATGLLVGLAARAEGPPAVPMLHLPQGWFVAGELKDSDEPDALRWQGTPFTAPFEFPLGRVNAIHWPSLADAPKPDGDYYFELAGGDVAFGRLVELD